MSVAALPTTFTDRAIAPVRKWRFSIIPCDVRGKGPYGLNAGKPRWGITSKTNTEQGVLAFAAQIPVDANYGICSDDTYTILETDDRSRLVSLLSRPLPDTFCVSARKNRGYMIFKQTAKTRAVRGLPEVPGTYEWRHHGYCVGPGSIHPETGKEYRLVRDIEPVEMPDWLVEELLALHKNAPPSVRKGETGEGEVDTDALSALLAALHRRGEPEDMLGIDGLVISSLHPTLKPLIAHLYQGPETAEEVADIVRRVGEAYGHRQPAEKDVEDIIEWLNSHNCKPCFCKDCDDAREANLPESFVWASTPNSEGPLWIFTKEVDFALFKHRIEQTPAWAYAAEWKDPEGWPEMPADYEAWRKSQKARGPTAGDWSLVRYTNIAATKIDWMWKGYLATGKLTMLNGEPGSAKSLLSLDIAARVSRGTDWADGTANPFPPSSVLVLTEEEDPSDTIKPRFLAAGGDPANLIMLNVGEGSHFQIEKDTPKLKKMLMEVTPAVRLLILDPVSDYAKINKDKDDEVRTTLNTLKGLAKDVGAAALGINHLNKKTDQGAIHRVSGARGWVSYARLNFLVGVKDGMRHLVTLKTNIVKNMGSFAFTLAETVANDGSLTITGIPVIRWQGKGELTPDDLMMRPGPTKAENKNEIETSLKDILKDGGWCSAEWALEQAEDRGWQKRSVQRAADKMGIEKMNRPGKPPVKMWRLPPLAVEQNDTSTDESKNPSVDIPL
jgi:putative DNA primase/helicase